MNWSLNITITMVGLVIVFGSLLLLSLFISLYPKLFLKQDHKAVKPSEAAAEEEIDEDELIAVIAAAIAEEADAGYAPGIIVKKIRRINGNNPIWNTAGRLESLNNSTSGGIR